MDELADLYQQLILDHNRSPRNRRHPEQASGEAEGYNPLCGDRVTVYVTLEGDVISDCAFQGTGCAISTAAASMMTQAVKGKTVQEVGAIFEAFHAMVAGSGGNGAEGLGKLAAFAGVRRFPARVKCATLAWHTMKAALEHHQGLVTTE